jgi:polyphosphate kinase
MDTEQMDPATQSVTDEGSPLESRFVNRDLSLLEFNHRVLQQALDTRIPLLERLRFLTISSTNLDEFFEVRAASHKEQVLHGVRKRTLDGRTSQETLEEVAVRARSLVAAQYQALNEVLLPELASEGIRIVRRSEWSDDQQAWAERYFREQVLPVMTPMGLDPAHPFPRIQNKSLNFIVVVSGHDAYERDADIAVVQVPRALPRVLSMPSDADASGMDLVLLSSLVHAHVSELFPGMEVHECHQFRVTRNGDLWVDEEEVENLLQALQGELRERQFAEAVRLEVPADCPDDLAQFLLENFDLDQADLYRVDGPVNLHRLSSILDLLERPDLRYAPFTPALPRSLASAEDPMAVIRSGDLLLHHPYESFLPVVELLRKAAEDPQVLAIKMTLYRVGGNSPIIEALVQAARSGKQVTTVIELRARFDEERNIALATRLQEVGASVVYGIVGYKTHSKMLMIVRREGEQLRRYCHLGTGNYHVGTARAYTDLSLLTADPALGEDVHQMFLQLTGLGEARPLQKILQSPFTMHGSLIDLIDAEAEAALRGEDARIVAKLNALTEVGVIEALYRASQAGVRVDLVIRGACCLRPGVPGLSETITVRSILGRFLEHSRIYWFRAGGANRVYCSSADWMSRNLIRRVESCFPIEDPVLRARMMHEDLINYLRDDIQAWVMQPDGSYVHTDPAGELGLDHPQEQLLTALCSPDA